MSPERRGASPAPPVNAPDPKGVYIHIPFCLSKCAYCDFASRPLATSAELENYLWFLKHELVVRGSGCATTVFFGGGTPSLCSPEQLESVIAGLVDRMRLSVSAEISLEANPGTLTPPKIRDFRKTGINRLSIGVQSTLDAWLRMLGRRYSAREARDAVSEAKGNGFDNVSCDLIYGLPSQSLQEFKADLTNLAGWDPDHLSLYALSLEPGTPLAALVEKGSLPEPDDDLVADMYEWGRDYLASLGYRHYELSNFAKPGRECRHNLVYWRNQDYLGLGASAHSCLEGVRSWNHARPEDYVRAMETSADATAGRETLAGRAKVSETLMLGLRLLEGIKLEEMEVRFGPGWKSGFETSLAEMSRQGLVTDDCQGIRLTRRGCFLSNMVFRALL